VSQENVEVVMSLYPAVQGRDYTSPFEALDEDIVWDMSGFALPDVGKVYRGHDGVRAFWGDWLAVWETVEFKNLVPEDHGDHVVVEVHQRNTGRGSGVEVDFRYFQVFPVGDGKVVACHIADTKVDALGAVGLSK
jgi:ketosteroid isomerase-like protein